MESAASSWLPTPDLEDIKSFNFLDESYEITVHLINPPLHSLAAGLFTSGISRLPVYKNSPQGSAMYIYKGAQTDKNKWIKPAPEGIMTTAWFY